MNKEQSQEKRSYRYTIMVVGSIVTALIFVLVSLSLYKTSGTAQLDLSRPGYAAIRKQVNSEENKFEGFSSDGELDANALSEFDRLYQKQLERVTSYDAYGRDVLSPEALQIDQKTTKK